MSDDMLKDHAIRLFTFLSEFSELGSKKIRTIEGYEEIVWLSDISQEKGYSFFSPDNDGKTKTSKDIWLTLDKPKDKELEYSKVYSDLFALYQHQQRLGESYDIVLGLGYLTWETPSGHTIKRHLVTSQTQFYFEPDEGKISVGPSSDGANITLEQDMLDAAEQPDISTTMCIDKFIGQLDDNIFDKDILDLIFETWIEYFPGNSGYHGKDMVKHDEIATEPKISFAPAFILRKRTERNFVRAFSQIIGQLRDAEVLPKGVENLVKRPDKDYIMLQEKTGSSQPEASQNFIYFPLPANDEQIEIARQLEQKDAVLVQGPPGTGKSHTIANLICHLLASGKKVLVTSHASRALAVLREKIPPEIASLCVIALSDDVMSLNALETSVNGITEKRNTWNEIHNQKEIDFLQKELETALAQEQKILANFKKIRESEVQVHPKRFGAYEGTLTEIALQIREEEPEYSWVNVNPKESQEAPLRNAEALDLLNSLRQIDEEQEREVKQFFLNSKNLPAASDFSTLVRSEQEAKEKSRSFETLRQHPDYGPLERAREIQRLQLRYAVDNILRKVNSLSNSLFSWAGRAAIQTLKGNDLTYQELYRLTQNHLEKIGNDAELLENIMISGLDSADKATKDILLDAQDFLEHLKSGGKLGFWKLRPQVVKNNLYLLKKIRVDGQFCDNPETVKKFIKWLEVANHFEELNRIWSLYTDNLPPAALFSIQKTEYKRRLECLEDCLAINADMAEAKGIVQFIAEFTEPAWHDLKSLTNIIELIDAANSQHILLQKSKELETILENLQLGISDKPDVHKVAVNMIEAITNRDYLEYAKSLKKNRELEILEFKINQKNILLSRLKRSMPSAAAGLVADPHNPVWDQRFAKFQNAWNWAKAEFWLKSIADLKEYDYLREQSVDLRFNIQQIMAKLAAAKAWKFCLTKLTDHESSHLKAWQLAIKRIGKGTGNKVSLYRKEARTHLEECRTAIPAWIMPIYRVVETINMKPDIFDVVIIDEASQSGPEALILQYIAKKIVVVGDSKQISPSFIGINKEDVDILRQKLIPDLPFSDSIGIENSFFDQAFIRYRGQICLREHFRCMPEIIQFSNDLCYNDTPLIPLKQFGADRLNPPVSAKYVEDGYQKGKSPRMINPNEARAITIFIDDCLSDKKYKGKTFGVISLLGDEQTKLINRLLLDKIGSQEMEKRKLVCGDAYAFQGDERDVIILSMVSAPGEGYRVGSLTVPDAQKRFNVATSRAKEQLVLFHSAKLEELNPVCLRYRLLKYCQNPKIELTDQKNGNNYFAKLKELAGTDHRQNTMPPPPFDNWFEVDVFLDIWNKGYRVIPKFNVAGYYIDLVVEGLQGRLAVKCYGDSWQGAAAYEQDMIKQQQLERSGYGFWRVRGSLYYRNREAVMASLWELLTEMRIFPQEK